MVAVAARKSDSHLSSEWSVARAVESGRVVESGLVVESGRVVESGLVVESGRAVESGLAVGLKLPNAGAPSLKRELVAGRWPARSERTTRPPDPQNIFLGDLRRN